MKTTAYSLKISPQGQLTLPRQLREQLQLQPGARVTVMVGGDGALHLSDKPPIAEYFGTLAGAWTEPGQDAAAYTRQLRDGMQPRLGR